MKVARLLRDTTLLQFYPTLFSLATDILDMLGDMVWERIKRKAEYLEDGIQFHALPGILLYFPIIFIPSFLWSLYSYSWNLHAKRHKKLLSPQL